MQHFIPGLLAGNYRYRFGSVHLTEQFQQCDLFFQRFYQRDQGLLGAAGSRQAYHSRYDDAASNLTRGEGGDDNLTQDMGVFPGSQGGQGVTPLGRGLLLGVVGDCRLVLGSMTVQSFLGFTGCHPDTGHELALRLTRGLWGSEHIF